MPATPGKGLQIDFAAGRLSDPAIRS